MYYRLKKQIKKFLPLILFIFVFITLLSLVIKFYSTGLPEPVSATQINDILIKNDFNPIDMTELVKSNFLNTGLKSCTLIVGGGVIAIIFAIPGLILDVVWSLRFSKEYKQYQANLK